MFTKTKNRINPNFRNKTNKVQQKINPPIQNQEIHDKSNELEDNIMAKSREKNQQKSKDDNNQIVEDDYESFSSDDSSSEDETGSDTENNEDEKEEYSRTRLKNVKYSKEALQYVKDNKIIFVDKTGKPLEEGAKLLFDNNKLEQLESYDPSNIRKSVVNRKYYFTLCLENSESLIIKKIKLKQLLIKFKLMLIENKISNISIARSSYIALIPWAEFLSILGEVFNDTMIEITICSGTLIYVPLEDRDKIFEIEHSSPINGHKGISKSYNRLKNKYFWPNMKEDIRKRVQFCLKCQLKKLLRRKTKLPMVITDHPCDIFSKVSLDIFGPLPETKNGNKYILTLQCQFSKFCLAAAMPDALSTTIASNFIKKCICVFGIPDVILTDRGQNFLSSLMHNVCKRFKINKTKTTSYMPSSNGSLERTHIVLAEFLKQYTDKDNCWDEWIDLAIFSYNTSVHEGTKFSPYEIIFAKVAKTPSDKPIEMKEQSATYDEYLINLTKRLIEIRQLANDNLVKSKERSKKYYDRNVNVQEFKIGSFVFLQSGPKPGKLENHYSGPFKVIQVLKKNNVKILVKKNRSKIVHSNRLKLSHIKPKNH